MAKSISNERIAWCALLILLIIAAIVRYRCINVPLERDEGEYAYAGQLILQGIPPYLESYSMKFPGVYVVYALFLAVFGQSCQGIHMGLLIINAITIILVFLLAKHIANSLCAVVSAATFALLSISQSVEGVFANAEHFVILFTTAGLLVLLRGLSNSSLFRLFAAGILLGLGFLMKQHGLAFSAFAGLYIIYDSLRQYPFLWHDLALRLLSFTGGTLIVLASLCLIMIWTGVFKSFWFWTVDYALAYISPIGFSEAWPGFITNFTAVIRSAPFLWILAGFGFPALLAKRISEPHQVFLLMYALFSFASICPGFYFRPHYFVLLLPCAGLFAGVAISALADYLSRFFSKKIQYGIPLFLIVICLCQSIYKQRDFLFNMTPFQISRSIYGLNPFPESIMIADFIKKHTKPDDRIAILGSEPQIFFYSHRRSASGYIYMYPMMENHKFALTMQKDFIKDIEIMNPKFLIYVVVSTSWLRHRDSHNAIFQWVNNCLQKGHLKLVGTVELLKSKSIYQWGSNAKRPTSSPLWVAVFKRIV